MARAGRFGTKGLAITFVSDENDAKILNEVQDRFEVNISELPDEIDISSYSECSRRLLLAGGMKIACWKPEVECGSQTRVWSFWGRRNWWCLALREQSRES